MSLCGSSFEVDFSSHKCDNYKCIGLCPWSTAAVSQRERSVWLAAVLEALAPVQYRQMCCITSRTFFSERLALCRD